MYVKVFLQFIKKKKIPTAHHQSTARALAYTDVRYQ